MIGSYRILRSRESRSARSRWIAIGAIWAFGQVAAQHSEVESTVHNLSVSGPGEVRAVSETEICKFCHIPHNPATPEQLWSRELSTAQYVMPQPPNTQLSESELSQPDGSSRLCLSCHDGTIALGDVVNEPRPIAMAGVDVLGPGRKGFLGTDLTGSHPISFEIARVETDPLDGSSDLGLKPQSAMISNPFAPLDARGKMQCTTCHDPHSDQYYQEGLVPRFWVRPTVEEVCVACHELR